jgi:RNA polymerase sigma-70 factor (ECF subfamily)
LTTELVALRAALIHHAMIWAKNRTDAEDLVHTAFERALERRHKFRADTCIEAWCRRVIRNLAIDRARETKRSRLVARDGGLSVVLSCRSEPKPWWTEIDVGDLGAALERCTPVLRETFELRHGLGLSTVAVAARMNVKLNTVTTRMFRVRARLRRELSPREHAGDLRARAKAA